MNVDPGISAHRRSQPLRNPADQPPIPPENNGVLGGADADTLLNPEALSQLLLKELQFEIKTVSTLAQPGSLEKEEIAWKPTAAETTVIQRMVLEVDRICTKSDRIQSSGQMRSWQLALARHRLRKCIDYYKLGSRRGRVELHSNLSAIVYRYVAPPRSQLNFQGRYNLIEDFLQGFYIESLKAFRRENQLEEAYSPRIRLELAEYMAFTEQYARRRITLPGQQNQQLIVLRAQGFAKRQPPEATLDIELAMESARGDELETHSRSSTMQQVREQMTAEVVDPAESVLRGRVVIELVKYLEEQGHTDCVDYLTLKLQDLSAPEIDDILGLSPRQRDYLQQRFKYHVEKFSRSHHWKLVHQWLGADLDQNLGLLAHQWEIFSRQLSDEQRHLLQLKRSKSNDSSVPKSDEEIAHLLQCTPKQLQKRWQQVLELAWQVRNQGT